MSRLLVVIASTVENMAGLHLGGSGATVFLGPDSSYIATDDMHRLEDGATGHAEIGEGAVVGVRSLVRGQKVAPRTAVAGTPARVIREDVRWSEDDTP